jgi:CopY/TcrY family copper transport repressor
LGVETIKISDAEWEVMRVIWTKQKTTAAEITEILASQKDWQAATIKTLLGRLVKKDVLHTEKVGKKFIYSAQVTEAQTVRSATENLFSHICATKIGSTIAELIAQADLTAADLAKINEQLVKKEPVAEIKCNCIPGQCQCKNHHHHIKMNVEGAK